MVKTFCNNEGAPNHHCIGQHQGQEHAVICQKRQSISYEQCTNVAMHKCSSSGARTSPAPAAAASRQICPISTTPGRTQLRCRKPKSAQTICNLRTVQHNKNDFPVIWYLFPGNCQIRKYVQRCTFAKITYCVILTPRTRMSCCCCCSCYCCVTEKSNG